MFAALLSLTGCQEHYVTYEDAEYIGFSDTLSVVAVQDSSLISIPVISTVNRDYDRTVAVEIVDSKSNAVEKLHYALESNTVTIPAGSNKGEVLLRGFYDNMVSTDSLCFTMKLVMTDKLLMGDGSEETRIQLRKVVPFKLEDFTGWCVFTSMFHREFQQPYQRLVKTYKVDGKENAILCRNMFNEGYDVELCFDNSDPLSGIVTMPEEQIVSDEATFFGQTKGDNHIRAVHSPLAPSFFFTNEKMPYIALWSMLYVKNLGEMVGTVGHFYSVMEWISEKEARRLSKEDGLPGFFEEKN